MSRVGKSLRQPVLKVVVTIGLFALIFRQLGGIGELTRLFLMISPLFVLLTLVAVNLDRALMTFKWTRLLAAQGMHLGLFSGMRIYCASMVSGIVMPMTVGADAVRTYMAARIGLDPKRVVASIVVERAIGFFASLLVGLAGFLVLTRSGLLGPHFSSLWWTGGAVWIGAAGVFALSFHPAVYAWLDHRLLARFGDSKPLRLLRDLQSNYRIYGNQKGLLLEFFGLSVLEQLTSILYMWLVARGLGVEVGLLYFAGALPLALLISRLPVSFHGLGLFDGVFALLLSYAGVPVAQAIAITLGIRVLELAGWFPWWFAYVIERSPWYSVGSAGRSPEVPERP